MPDQPAIMTPSCAQCGFELSPGAKFCSECGARTVPRCKSCATELAPTAKFCSECGAPVARAVTPAAAAPPPILPPQAVVATPPPAPARSETLQAERTQLTVMFCDLVGSTTMAEQLDPEDLHAVLTSYHEACAKVISRFEGHIAKYMGDGLLVYFGYPRAHEDDAHRAVRAGLGMVEAMERLAEQVSERHGVRLAMRVGIHTGLVVIGEVGAEGRRSVDIVGETPNVAARLQEQARPNTVIISAATYRLVDGFFACQERGLVDLKGVSRPMRIYWAQHESTARTRLEAAVTSGTLTPLVGREAEMAVLLECWEKAAAGEAQTVLMCGEPGLGKSRLLHMLREHIAKDPRAWMTELYASATHKNSALHPVIDFMERVSLKFERGETARERLTKIEALLVQYGLPLRETVPLFASMLSVPYEPDYAPLPISLDRQRQKLLEAWHEILKRIADQQPVLFVVEDLHWVDPTTLDLLSMIIEQPADTRVLAVFTFRPVFSSPWPASERVRRIDLERLTPAETEALISRVTGGKPLPPEVHQQIASKTEGIPLFVEELTKMVLESGLLVEREDAYALSGPLPPLAIPSTLHESLIARLDRLSSVREVAQWAAALGREFTHELLTAVVPYDPESLDRDLAQLVRAEILFLQEAHGGGCAYRFKHALIQDAAYESLLRSQRQQYHLRIATVLEMRFPETGRSQPELLAHHYTEAAVPDRAVPYWQAAGERSLARSAHREAIGHLERARDQLAALPAGPERHRREIKLLVLLGAALTATRGYGVPEVEEAYTRARDLSREWGEVEELFRAQYGLWRLHMLRADYAVSRAQGEELLRLAREARNPSFLVAAHRALGGILFYMGALDECREHLLEVITGTPDDADGPNSLIQDVYDVVDPRVSCRSYHAWSLWLSGRPDEALAESERAIALARSLDHPFSIALALSFGTWLRQFRGEVRETLELARAALEISTEQGFLFWIGWARVLEGWALAQEGACEQSCEEGLARIRQGLEEWATRGSALGRSYFLALRAEVCLDCGRLEEAAESLTEARAFAAATGERYWLPELDRLRGRMHALEGDTDAAADAYRSAAAAARAHQFPALEVRALASLEELEARAG